MIFSIKDRLLIGNFFPKNGNLLEMTVVNELKEKFKITSDELITIGFKQEGNQMKWDEKKEQELIIELRPVELELLKKELKIMDSANQISLESIDLAIKINEA